MIYRFVRFLFAAIVFRIIFPLDLHGRENIPAAGPFIICANHISWFDPPLVVSVIDNRNRVCFMTKEELFRFPLFKWLLKKMGAFPVRRKKADRGAIMHALQVLKEEGIVGLFPEGTRNKNIGEPFKVEDGVAMLVLYSGVPVLPIAVRGPYRIFRPLEVRIGPVLSFEKNDKKNKDDVTKNSKKYGGRRYKKDEKRRVAKAVMESIQTMLV